MNKRFKSLVERLCPMYALIPLIGCFALDVVVYEGTKFFEQGRYHFDFTTAFDRSIPVISWFTTIYYGCYIFWVYNLAIVTKISKEHFYRSMFAVYISFIICAIIYIVMPTTNVRPEVVGNSIFDKILRFIYKTDTPENLFPSIHCSVSWFCYICIRGKKEIKLSYRIFSVIFAIIVFICTQVTKQHYIVDVFSGVALAEICFYISKKTNLYQSFMNFFEGLNKKLNIE